jgi:hypothetical protein
VAALISTEPAGGPRPLPGVAAGSVGASVALAGEVVVSVGGGAARSELLDDAVSAPEAGAPVELELSVAVAGLGESDDAVTVAPPVEPEPAAVTVGAAADRPDTLSEPAPACVTEDVLV